MFDNVSRRSAVVGTAAVAGAAALGTVGAPNASAAGNQPTPPKPTTGSVPAFPGVLKYGTNSRAVYSLQQALAASGFWLGTADGSFGPATRQAVWALQKRHGLARSGQVDATTWTRAHQKLRTNPRYPSLTGIEIDLSRQLLIVVEKGVAQLTLNTSTGNGSTFKYYGGWAKATTPKGTFPIIYTIKEDSRGWATGPLGTMYRPRFFTRDGIAIHGSLDIPAYPASHGCCRVSTAGQDHLLRTGRLAMGRVVRVY